VLALGGHGPARPEEGAHVPLRSARAAALWIAVALSARLAAQGPPGTRTEPAGSPHAREALAICGRVDAAPTAEKAALIARGLALAEQAVAEDERDAPAHLAVFCSLGKQMRLSGVALSSLTALRRLRHEVDRALELAPEYTDALVGKGSLLLGTPRLLGGDPVEGERLLRVALRSDPDALDARLELARGLAARGARDEARSEAQHALAVAEREEDSARAAEARQLLGRLSK